MNNFWLNSQPKKKTIFENYSKPAQIRKVGTVDSEERLYSFWFVPSNFISVFYECLMESGVFDWRRRKTKGGFIYTVVEPKEAQ